MDGDDDHDGYHDKTSALTQQHMITVLTVGFAL